MSEMLEREKKRKADSPAERKQQGSVSELFNLQSNIEIQIFFAASQLLESLIFTGSFFSSQRKSRKSKFSRD